MALQWYPNDVACTQSTWPPESNLCWSGALWLGLEQAGISLVRTCCKAVSLLILWKPDIELVTVYISSFSWAQIFHCTSSHGVQIQFLWKFIKLLGFGLETAPHWQSDPSPVLSVIWHLWFRFIMWNGNMVNGYYGDLTFLWHK